MKRNLRDEHEQARELIAFGDPRSQSAQSWLRSHLQGCPACRDYSDQVAFTVRTLRSQPLAADASLVQATQMRVRARALELQRDRERLGIVWICCVAVTLGTIFPTAALWRGFAWIGQQASLPGPVWQTALFVVTLIPAVLAGMALLLRGTYLADRETSDAR